MKVDVTSKTVTTVTLVLTPEEARFVRNGLDIGCINGPAGNKVRREIANRLIALDLDSIK